VQSPYTCNQEIAFKLSKERAAFNANKHTYHKAKKGFTPEKFTSRYEEKLTLKTIAEKIDQKVYKAKFKIPTALYNRIETVIKTEYFNYYNSTDNRLKRVYNTKLEQALYFCLAIIHFNYYKDLDFEYYLSEREKNGEEVSKEDINDFHRFYISLIGCELSKHILTQIISNKDLYIIKDILLRYNIVGTYPLYNNYIIDKNKRQKFISYSFYSKNLKAATRYFINEDYSDFANSIKINNKYADKHLFLLDNHLLFGKKKEMLHKDYLPFKHPEKILQYEYAKNMSLNIPLTKIRFLQRFPNLNKIVNWWNLLKNIKYKKNNFNVDKEYIKSIIGQEEYKNIISLFSKLIDFHKHIFNASEKYRKNLFTFT
jgi:hypothetical protein